MGTLANMPYVQASSLPVTSARVCQPFLSCFLSPIHAGKLPPPGTPPRGSPTCHCQRVVVQLAIVASLSQVRQRVPGNQSDYAIVASLNLDASALGQTLAAVARPPPMRGLELYLNSQDLSVNGSRQQ